MPLSPFGRSDCKDFPGGGPEEEKAQIVGGIAKKLFLVGDGRANPVQISAAAE